MARHTVYVQGGSVQIGDTRHPATACPLIAFDPLSARAYGSGSFALAATASSGLPVSYVSSDHGVATISGSSVTLVGAGAATITASQAGDGVYAAATNISQVLAVNPGVATVALDNLIQGYNGTVRSVTATPTPAGLAVSVTYDGWPTAPTNAGSYTVVATVTDPNCQGSNSATSQITPKALTVRGITAASTIYDGTTTAKLGGAATLLPAEAPGQGTPAMASPTAATRSPWVGRRRALWPRKMSARGP